MKKGINVWSFPAGMSQADCIRLAAKTGYDSIELSLDATGDLSLESTDEQIIAHRKLAEWEQQGKLSAVVTQNIDGLHQAAGSRRVLELHGSVHRNYCERCGKYHSFDFVLQSEGVPQCSCGGRVKPDVVLYEEGLDTHTINGAVDAIAAADLLIIGGTSLNVYPAAGLINYYRGRDVVLINKSAVARDLAASLVITDPIGEVLSQL